MRFVIHTSIKGDHAARTAWHLGFTSKARLRLYGVSEERLYGKEWGEVSFEPFPDRPTRSLPQIPKEVLIHAKRALTAMVENLNEIC